MIERKMIPLVAVLCGAVLLGCGSSGPGMHIEASVANADAKAAAGVLPPKSHPYGASYGEWSARWWQWALSLPADGHPLIDGDCSTGQSGHVWFLGDFTGEVAVRECVVPTGTALFFPVLNIECSTLEGNGMTAQELSECATFIMSGAEDLAASIDGRAVRDLAAHRAQAQFTFGPLPDGNVLQQVFGVEGAVEGASSPAAADGVYLMIAPLPAGEHTLHFEGAFRFTVEEHGFDLFFPVDVTYEVTVR